MCSFLLVVIHTDTCLPGWDKLLEFFLKEKMCLNTSHLCSIMIRLKDLALFLKKSLFLNNTISKYSQPSVIHSNGGEQKQGLTQWRIISK